MTPGCYVVRLHARSTLLLWLLLLPREYALLCRVLEAADLLRSYALSKGWVAASGLPDETRSGRQILKDFVNGKLLHCERPPTCSMSNTQLGLSGQTIAPSKLAAPATRAGASGSSPLQVDQAEAQLNGLTHSQSDSDRDSAAELGHSSEQDTNELSEEEGREGSDSAHVSSSSEAEASTAHVPVMSDADRELMESMSAPQGNMCTHSKHLSITCTVTSQVVERYQLRFAELVLCVTSNAFVSLETGLTDCGHRL